MKRLIPYISFFSLAITQLAFAADPKVAPYKEDTPDMELSAVYNHVDRAKFTRTRSQRHHHLSYSEGFVLGTYQHKLPSNNDLNFGLGYMNTKFSFSHHPKRTSFKQHDFHNMLVQVGATSREIDEWKIDGGLGLQINTDHFSSRYTFFTGLLHGKQDYIHGSHLHVGIVAYSGLRYSRVLPILGFDYEFSKKLKLNAVFPLDMSLVYTIDDHWTIDTAIRFMLSRQRLNNNGTNPRGLVAYRNWGAEAGVTYAFNNRCKVNLHLGETFGGRMRISSKHNSHRKHLTLDSALYYGLEASFAF